MVFLNSQLNFFGEICDLDILKHPRRIIKVKGVGSLFHKNRFVDSQDLFIFYGQSHNQIVNHRPPKRILDTNARTFFF